jgi:cobalt-zinc-cadmium resistance protein CzcA
MLERLIDLAVERRIATLVVTLALALFGIHTLTKLKIEAFPDVTNVQVMVITLHPGQAAEELEKQITIPVERALFGVPNVLMQRSITSFGLSQVVETFEDGLDIYFARQQVAERLPMPRCRESPPRSQRHPGRQSPYTLGVTSARRSFAAGRLIVEKQLMRVPGVADVVSFGGFQKEYHVLADAGRLRASGVTLRDLINGVHRSNGATSGGYVQYGESEFVVRSRGYLQKAAVIEDTVISAQNGTPIYVRNVARVVEGYTPRRGAVAKADAIDSVEGTILLRRGENPRDVLDGVHAAVDRINRDVLPKGMQIVPFYDRTKLVDTTLITAGHNMVEGAALVALVLWLFLRALAGSVAVAVTMPLAALRLRGHHLPAFQPA